MFVMANANKKGGLGEAVRTVIYAVLIAAGIRTVAFEPFNIPSESMLPTLLVGDYLFVAKYAYGYSRYSLPFGPPVGAGRVLARAPERGDVAVFKFPFDNSTDYIKRIIGLPGDRIQMRGGRLYLNGEAVRRDRVDDFRYPLRDGRYSLLAQYRETLPNGVSYLTLDLQANSSTDDTDVFVVPPEHYFAMGDNRDNSLDSRVPVQRHGVGFVPAVNLVGRADVLFFSVDGSAPVWEFWHWLSGLRFARFFTAIH
jgi:signal peptidase I